MDLLLTVHILAPCKLEYLKGMMSLFLQLIRYSHISSGKRSLYVFYYYLSHWYS